MAERPRRRHLAVEGLSKTYGSGDTAVQALRGVDLDVTPGELWMLSGPSGCGKTTLLQTLGCVLKPSSGRVWLQQREVGGLSEAERAPIRLHAIGFVFQDPGLFDSLSTVENVALPLRLRGISRRESHRLAEDALAAVGLGDKRRSQPRELSGGQRQRVGIARALAGSAPILLADEPTAALDAANGAAVMELLTSLCHARGHTALVVTHDPRIAHFADRLVHMEDGRIEGVREAA